MDKPPETDCMEVGDAKRSGIRTDVTIEYRQVSTYNHVALDCTSFGAGALTYTFSLTLSKVVFSAVWGRARHVPCDATGGQ